MMNQDQEESDGADAREKLEYHATVRDLPRQEQPRERLRHAGPQALAVAELLAIVLRVGTQRDNALELAGKLLAKYGGLGGLVRADFDELCSEYGMGEAKTAQLKAGRLLEIELVDHIIIGAGSFVSMKEQIKWR